jgi:hypothetical protein
VTLQSRLLGVFAQYPDPRVGVLTTELVRSAAPRFSSLYLRSASKYDLPGLVQAYHDFAELENRRDFTDEERASFWQLPSLLSDEDAHHVGAYWFDMLQGGDYYDSDVRVTEPTKYDALVPWLARLVAVELRSVRKGKQDANALYTTLRSWPRELSAVADWAHATHPDLMRLTWNQAVYRTRRWHAALARQEKAKALSSGEVVYRYSDGWTVQRLTTAEHLRDEGRAMGHCIGGSHYFDTLLRGTHAAFSIRDEQGVPKVTLYGRFTCPDPDAELVLEQAKLRANRLPQTRDICHRIAEAGVALRWVPFLRFPIAPRRAVIRSAKWPSDLEPCWHLSRDAPFPPWIARDVPRQ